MNEKIILTTYQARPGFCAYISNVEDPIGILTFNKCSEYISIYGFQVKGQYQRHEIGKKLMHHLIEYAGANNISRLVVYPGPCSDIEQSNMHTKDIVKVYQKLGFELDDTSSVVPKLTLNI